MGHPGSIGAAALRRQAEQRCVARLAVAAALKPATSGT
jgi:hypothetical protein